MRAPTFGEVERFCKLDGWQQDTSVGGSRQPHVRYEKQIAGQRALRTQISHDRSSTPSPGRWKAMLRNQLRITEDQFWDALRSGDPVDRTPPPPPPTPIPVDGWVREGLRRAGMREEEIDALGPAEAQRELHRIWSGGSAKS